MTVGSSSWDARLSKVRTLVSQAGRLRSKGGKYFMEVGPRCYSYIWLRYFKGFAGNKLVGIGQVRSCSGNTPRLHLQELVTDVDVHRDFIILRAMFHVLPTYVLRAIRNTKLDSGGIEHLGKAFFLDAVGGGPVVCHLAKKIKRVRILRQILFLCSLTVPKTPTGVLT
jgi:hypothetical protein